MSTTESVSMSTNGSFQNHTPAATTTALSSRSRKRGIAALSDITNLSNESQPRDAGQRAKRALDAQATRFAPRGDPKQGARMKHRVVEFTSTVSESASLLQLMGDKSVSSNISETLLTYTQRNVSHEMKKAIAITIMATAVAKRNCSIVEAANRAADCCGLNGQTVRRWASAFATNTSTSPLHDMTDEDVTDILSSGRGHHDSHPANLLQDENFCLAAREYVRKPACRKGEPNLTSKMFAEWICTELNTKIRDETARRWLIKLGFSRVHHQKGVYFDGHEREDVIACRDDFLMKMTELDKKSISVNGSVPQVSLTEKPLIRVVHDECTYYANSDQTFFWGDDRTNVLRQKSLGASIMVSDFVDEVSGYVRDEQGQARLLLETHREGYFTNDLLLEQVGRTIDIFDRVHPYATALFLFGNTPSHRKVPEDALNVDRMNVGPGGKQPKMRDTVWGGAVQKLVDECGIQRGMRAVLEERGVDTTGMRAKDMRQTLKTFPDFNSQKTILEEYIENRGHICMFYPKFHCELSPIERVWCQSKKYTRAYADGTITRLRRIVPEGLDSVTPEQIIKFFKTCRDYENAYREGCTGREVEERVKVYKLHRRIYRENS